MSEVKAVQDYASHILNNAKSYGIVQVKDNEVHLKISFQPDLPLEYITVDIKLEDK